MVHQDLPEKACLICGTPRMSEKVLDVEDMVSFEAFSLFRCLGCGVMQTLPVPEDLRGYYDTDLGRMMVNAPSRTHAYLKGFLLGRELRRILACVHPKQFIDVGCGPGDFACQIQREGHSVITADAGENPPPAVRENGRIPYYRINFNDYEIKGMEPVGSSLVILRHVLEHIRNPRMFLKRMLQNGVSYFYIVVPNTACLERRILGRYWALWDPPRHLWHFNQASLGALFRSLGMTVLSNGYDTIPNIIPSLYRYLRLKKVSPKIYHLFNPKGFLTSISAPMNLLFPRNVTWFLVSVSNGKGV